MSLFLLSKKQAANDFAATYTVGYELSLQALAANKGKVNIVHKAVHDTLMSAVPSYKAEFNEYAAKRAGGAPSPEIAAAQHKVALKALAFFAMRG